MELPINAGAFRRLTDGSLLMTGEISTEYHVEPKKVASLLDTTSCIFQGLIPYGAQLLVASSLARITSVSIIPFLFYQFLLIIFVLLSILVDRK